LRVFNIGYAARPPLTWPTKDLDSLQRFVDTFYTVQRCMNRTLTDFRKILDLTVGWEGLVDERERASRMSAFERWQPKAKDQQGWHKKHVGSSMIKMEQPRADFISESPSFALSARREADLAFRSLAEDWQPLLDRYKELKSAQSPEISPHSMSLLSLVFPPRY
jgi:hypothetical protein